MNMRIKLATFIIPLGLILAAIPENTTRPYKLSAEEMIREVQEGAQFVSTDQIAEMIIQKDPSLQLVDVRSKDQYEKYHLPGALNIPLAELLSVDMEAYINQDVKMNVFYSNGVTSANEAWMITRQLGYTNNYVMMGGMNFWAETILSPTKPSSTSPDDEFAKYDFRKAASGALGGGSLTVESDSGAGTPMPAIKKRPKKKRVAGGC